MFKTKEEIKVKISYNYEGKERMYLSNLADFNGVNKKIRTFAHIKLLPGEESKYHIHNGESESYYILSGKGLYNDNGTEYVIKEGDVTLTLSGNGHGIKNNTDDILEFIALILLD